MDEVARVIDSVSRFPVIDSLLEAAEREPNPQGDASSYWKRLSGSKTVVRQRNHLLLQGFGVASGNRQPVLWQMAHALERFSHRRLTNRLRSYPQLWRLTQALARDLSSGLLTFEAWKCTMILAVLTDHWRTHRLSPMRFAMIGDGSGFLGALIRRAVPAAKMYCIDLPKSLVFQAVTHTQADTQASLGLIAPDESSDGAVTFVRPALIDQIPGPIDCAINIASMQEMSYRSIGTYFTWLRRRSHAHAIFYCVNREEKVLPGGEVIRFDDYPWHAEDEIYLDGPCPYYQYHVTRSAEAFGPRMLGLRIPFINYFEGVTRHRLVHLAPE